MKTDSIEKILVAIDFGDEADDILQMAGELGRGLSAELHLVHIYLPNLDIGYEAIMYPVYIPGETIAEHEERLQEERKQIHGQAEKLRKAGAKTFGYMQPVEKGTAESILAFAEEIHADMIVIGTSRPNRIEEFLVGSVAKQVLKKSPVPVLLVPRAPVEK